MNYAKLASYLPHTAPMVLLEQVIAVDDESAHCEVQVSPNGVLGRFLDKENNLPAWYAIELLAQTVGVWFGWHQQQNQHVQPEIGLLLGGRGIKCQSPVFPAGTVLSVIITLQLKGDNIGSFDGEIRIDGHLVAQGRLTTYLPKFDELNTLFSRNGIPT